MLHHLLLLLLIAEAIVAGANAFGSGGGGGIYKLPELAVRSLNGSYYLTRSEPTRLECIIAGQLTQWPNTTLDRILWMKDGTPVDELRRSAGPSASADDDDGDDDESMEEGEEVLDFEVESPSASASTLLILHSNHHTEGDYQCSAIVRNIQLSPTHLEKVDARLVSAPVKLRRARLTKFERHGEVVVKARQGQVARLACVGLPDVIPGPPEVWFEKQGHEGLPLGRTGNERFIATPTGLQIALVQPSDAGRYYCLVRNFFTNQTRRAPRPVILVVEPRPPTDSNRHHPQHGHRRHPVHQTHHHRPSIIYPPQAHQGNATPPHIHEYHVVVGQMALLECIIWNAKVVWDNADLSLPAVSLTDDRVRIRQVWGNLRFKQVTLEDANDYTCHGIHPAAWGPGRMDLLAKEDDHPRVTYRLIVHAPTTVQLMLAQTVKDKAWQLSCHAQNLRYEIPMVYLNGLALIEELEGMGVPPHTNFFTNPINITLTRDNPLSGAVQCLSRPAMDEAEVYGSGLERGRAMNLYVDSRLNAKEEEAVGGRGQVSTSNAPPPPPLSIHRPVAFSAAGDNTIRVQWTVAAPPNDPRLSHLLNFVLEMRRKQHRLFEGTPVMRLGGDGEGEEAEWKWMVGEIVQPHVRALTVRRMVEPGYEYQFRVTANFNDRSPPLVSPPTAWLPVESIASQLPPMAPPTPQITRLQVISDEALLLVWEHNNNGQANGRATNFLVNYAPSSSSERERRMTVEVGANTSEMLLRELDADTEYLVTVAAENAAGRSEESPPRIARTHVLIEDYNDEGGVEKGWWGLLWRDHLPRGRFLVMCGFLLLAAFLLAVLCFLTLCRLREFWRRQCGSSSDSSEFFNANSPPIHSSHRLRKRSNQIYHEPSFFATHDPIEELSPLECYENGVLANGGTLLTTPSSRSKNQNSTYVNTTNGPLEPEYISRKQLQTRLPNVYGHSGGGGDDGEECLSEDDPFGQSTPLHNQHHHSHPRHQQPAMLQRCPNGGTLLRLHRTHSHRSISIPVSIPHTPYTTSAQRMAPPQPIKSPTPSATFSVYTNQTTNSPPPLQPRVGGGGGGDASALATNNSHSPDSNPATTTTTTTNSSVNEPSPMFNSTAKAHLSSSTFKPPPPTAAFAYSMNSLDCHPLTDLQTMTLSRNNHHHPNVNGFGTLSRRTAHLLGEGMGHSDDLMSRSLSRFPNKGAAVGRVAQ